MGRRAVDLAPLQPLALRRDEAAAVVGMSVESFDVHVRPNIPAVRAGAVTVYPVTGLATWLERNASIVADDLGRRRAA